MQGQDNAETAQEMLDRLSLIVLGERDCDLSDNDTAALEWALTTRAAMLIALKQIRKTCPTDPDATREFNVAWALLESAIVKAEESR